MLHPKLFLRSLKLISAILLFIFTLVQAVPVIQSLAPDTQISLFNPDEEKSEKGDAEKTEKKEAKDFTMCNIWANVKSDTFLIYSPAGVTIHPSPYVENHTPPPNFA